MKKIVPDPPPYTTPRKIITRPYFTIHSDLTPPDSLAYASELLRGIFKTTERWNKPRPCWVAYTSWSSREPWMKMAT